MSKNNLEKDDASVHTNDKKLSNKEIKESGQGTKLNNVNPTKALQEQAKKDGESNE
jgi:hypothetical protein